MRTKTTLSMLALAALAAVAACTKEEATTLPYLPAQATTPPANPSGMASLARYAGAHYSQSISVDEANSMIGSYLASVKFPEQDTAIRSFAFDADTLRAYLLDTSIVTLRFYIAHTPGYATAAETHGHYAGLKPGDVTLVVAGLNAADGVVRNKQNGVYDHMIGCPAVCSGNSSALIQ